ncbi:methyl-accepting chemotaxis like protein [[Synechococcus] sp. NIES-970]|nr:methyl-accepting chemotaxis like protein [[Synechococcus] sp. NIES-970]
MTTFNITDKQAAFSPEIQKLQVAIAMDPMDIMAKISLASQFEQEGFLKEAATVYEDIIATDTDGVFAASAQQALRSLTTDYDNSSDEPNQSNGNGVGTATAAPATFEPEENVEPIAYSAEILALKEAIANDPTDIMAQISLAIALENEGFIQEAADTYRYILDHPEQDPDGVFTGSAAKALEELQPALAALDPTYSLAQESVQTSGRSLQALDPQQVDYSDVDTTSPRIRWLRNLPIARKQFIGMFASSFIALTGVVGASIGVTVISGRAQLQNQVIAELAVTRINYLAKNNELGGALRGQGDNTAVIAAAREYQASGVLDSGLQQLVTRILQNETSARQIEYATLIGLDGRIIANANQNRVGENFDPNGLVSEVLQSPRRLQTNAIIDWAEIAREQPPLPPDLTEQPVLMNFTFVPVFDPDTQEAIAILMGGEVIDGKISVIRETLEAVGGGYSAIYHWQGDAETGSFELASSILKTPTMEATEYETNIPLPDLELLQLARQGVGGNLVDRLMIEDRTYTVAVQALANSQGAPIAFLVRGTPEDSLNALLRDSLLIQAAVGLGGIFVAAGLAWLLGRAITKPISKLQETAEEFGAGNLKTRAEVMSQDEVGRLAQTFNLMAEQIAITTEAVEEQSSLKQKEAEFQRQERERLQEGVIRLLLQIEEVRQGNLTVQAMVDEGEVGSIADAFNATLRSLRDLVFQVTSSADQVYDLAIVNNDLIMHLSGEATVQERAIQSAEHSVQGMAQSIQAVAKSAQGAAQIARKSRLAAQEGQTTMDETVMSIDLIRRSVADTSKKAKRLAESSQEISKIVNIIADISEKTNLLAFNASIEATRAGENGQGFRVVADEVRRLAEQVTTAAQDVEQLISGVQEETAQMMQMMEESTSQVVTGTELVKKTKTTLQRMGRISEEIDKVLARISKAMVSQQNVSGKVTKIMQSAAEVAQKTAAESKTMSGQLEALTQVAIALQESSSRFKID